MTASSGTQKHCISQLGLTVVLQKMYDQNKSKSNPILCSPIVLVSMELTEMDMNEK